MLFCIEIETFCLATMYPVSRITDHGLTRGIENSIAIPALSSPHLNEVLLGRESPRPAHAGVAGAARRAQVVCNVHCHVVMLSTVMSSWLFIVSYWLLSSPGHTQLLSKALPVVRSPSCCEAAAASYTIAGRRLDIVSWGQIFFSWEIFFGFKTLWASAPLSYWENIT